MEKSVIKVNGMSCGHCSAAVTKAVEALPGVSDVAVDLEGKTVTVEHDAAKTALEAIKHTIDDLGYEVV